MKFIKTKLKKGDQVKLMTGSQSGKTATVELVLPKRQKIVLAGVNLVKKHLKKSAANPNGGIKSIPAPVAWSNVSLVCPNCGKATKITIKRVDGKAYRVCKKCQKNIDKS